MRRTISRKSIVLLTLVFVFGFLIANKAMGQDKSLDIKRDTKINSVIKSASERIETHVIRSQSVGSFKLSSFSTPLIRVDDLGNIQAYIYLKDVNDGVLRELEAGGVNIEIVNEKFDVVQGWIPFERVEEIAELPAVLRIKNPDYGVPRTGSVITEGDMVLNSDVVRSMFGIDGTGVKVGVISDGVDNRASAQATDELPENIKIGVPGSGDEGTAMLEIIHDIAPGAELAFSEGFSSSLGFIQSIDFLVNTAEVDIIVDDIGFLGEPYFEDGIVAKEAEDAVASGVTFFSAAGNSAERHYEANYISAAPVDDPFLSQFLNDPHDFGGGDIAMSVLIEPRSFVVVVLQWNDPFNRSSNDYDLFLFNEAMNLLLDVSNDPQTGTQDPIELVFVVNSSSKPMRVNVVIDRFKGEPRLLEINFNGNITVEEFNVPDGSVFGHPAADGVIAVGAVPAGNSDTADAVIAVGAVPAGNPSTIEPFSSHGPSLIFFPFFEIRQTPRVVAPNDVSVTGAGGFPSPFRGTSAAAPHAAAVAALVLDAAQGFTAGEVVGILQSSFLTPEQVRDILEGTAIDLDAPGFDNTSGFGRLDALAAVQQVMGTISGDANADGMINVLDIVTTANDILGTAPAPSNADCNIDGGVNVLDIVCIANIILDL